MLVIHENRGLTDHIRTIPPRFAAAGFSALAIDLLSEEGGTAALGGDAQAMGALAQAPMERLIADLPRASTSSSVVSEDTRSPSSDSASAAV